VAIVQTYIENNQALGLGSNGGAIYAADSPLQLYNVTVSGNSAVDFASGLHLLNSTLRADHVTLAYNPAAGWGTAVVLHGSSLMTMTRSIIWGHASSIDGAFQNITCSDIQGGYTGAGNLNIAPGFVSVAAGDYHLRPDSEVIDRCAAGLPADIDNQARPVTLYNAAARYDMGADEVWLNLSLPLTLSD
jgi:predicted outer membrane repeat protein